MDHEDFLFDRASTTVPTDKRTGWACRRLGRPSSILPDEQTTMDPRQQRRPGGRFAMWPPAVKPPTVARTREGRGIVSVKGFVSRVWKTKLNRNGRCAGIDTFQIP